jgi:penicillin-binding protein 1C
VREYWGKFWRLRRIGRRVSLAVCLALVAFVINDGLALDLRGPSPSYLLLDRQGRFIAEIAEGEDGYGYWPVQELPPRVAAAALALEDRHFDNHPGIDPLAVARAAYQNLSEGKRVSGASTIAMQVARLLDPGERSYWHKLREAWRALVLTARYGRGEILAAYLRLVPYGNRVHGIAYAARRYLDKPVTDLSWAEIAFLSAIPQAPTLMNPFREDGRRRAIARGRRILEKLQDNGLLTAEEFEVAREQIGALQLPEAPVRPAHSLHAVFKLKRLLAGVPGKGAEPYRIVTTLDLNLQESVAAMAGEAVSEWENRGVGNAAVVLVDRRTNGVLAWLGSTNYFDHSQAGALDFAQAPRSPGSTLKPFFYALAYDQGKMTPATILDDLPSAGEGIVNADKAYLGPLLPRQALANSRNIPVARLLRDIGLEEGYSFLEELGLHRHERPARHYGLGLVIGAMPVTLESLVQAYSVLANDGRWQSLNWYVGHRGSERQLLSPGTARLVTLHLSDAGARLPSFPRMGSTEYKFPVALKTGTSQGLRDAWVVAYSQRYLLGIWVGHPDARPMHEITGATSAAELAKRILNMLHSDQSQGFADLGFPPPDGYRPMTLCALSGKRATPACDRVFEEWFQPGQEPKEEDDAFLRLAVDVRNGLLAHAGTPGYYIERRTFINLPPRYADWAVQAGLPRPPKAVSALGTSTAAVNKRSLALADGMPVGVKTALRVLTPGNGSQLLRDPSSPDSHNTIALQAEVSPPVRELLWMIDGQPYQLAPYPHTVRWPLRVGDHVIQVRVPFSKEASAPVHIRVE